MPNQLSPKQILKHVRSFDPRLRGRWQGRYLYLEWDGDPLARLHCADLDAGLWLLAIYKGSTESYSLTELGSDPPPLPLDDQLRFAAGFAKSYWL